MQVNVLWKEEGISDSVRNPAGEIVRKTLPVISWDDERTERFILNG